jgi:5-formyltetrahydrofolate cyclo-ligase
MTPGWSIANDLCRSAPRGKPRVWSAIPLDPWDQGRPKCTDAGGGPLLLAEDKSRIRREMRTARRALTPAALAIAACNLREQALCTTWFATGQCVGAYWAVGAELSLAPLLSVLLARGVHIYLPQTQPDGAMRFLRYRFAGDLVVGAHEIPSPIVKAGDPDLTAIAIDDLDVVLAPLLAFDASGSRLGQGGGYYDRIFQASPGTKRPRKIGIAFHFQRAERLPVEAFDQKLDAVITDLGVLNC